MAAIENTTTSDALAKAQDIEMRERFTHDTDRLNELLGITSVEVIPAGAALFQYTTKGDLNEASESYEEGDIVPLSKMEVERGDLIGVVYPTPYRKATTLKGLLKASYANAIVKTDKRMLSLAKSKLMKSYFEFLYKGTGTATGATLQQTLANMNATLGVTLEKNNDSSDGYAWFIHPMDVAAYLGTSNPIVADTVFGMQYLETFLGVTNVFVTEKATEKNPIVTPVENIHLYGVDFSTLRQAGFQYTTDARGLIGIHHDVSYERLSAITDMLLGVQYLAEVKEYIVKGTVTPLE